MANFIRVHDRRNGLSFLINTERIIAIYDYRNSYDYNYTWTDIITANKTFEVAETEQDLINMI